MSEFLTPQFIVELAIMVSAAGAVYGGIRADLKNLHAKTDSAQRSASHAHKRIDDMLLKE